MPNPILPLWEYIPDGEPRVFGDRVYLYGSHDRVGADMFCDYRLKVWSASVNDLNHWKCHGDSFHTRPDQLHQADTDWTDHELYAPDVVKKGAKYYLFAYILWAKGCVGVSDHPEGPFKLVSRYQYDESTGGDEGIFNDPGVLVDDDGRVYIYYGYEKSHMGEINPENMTEILPGSYRENLIPAGDGETDFFEASSIRKVNGLYYLIYSPRKGNRLAYAVSESPRGPFVRKGTIIDNGIDYPAGNNHGSICQINGQWYVFYHRMTNGTLTSRRACVEKINIFPDGTIPQVEMTSLGFEESLNPYDIVPADIACVLKGGCMITDQDYFTRMVTNIYVNSVIGYKYFDFGEDYTSGNMTFSVKVKGAGCMCSIHILLDDDQKGKEIGCCEIDRHDGVYQAPVEKVTGRHAVYLVIRHNYEGWFKECFDQRNLFDLLSFVFIK